MKADDPRLPALQAAIESEITSGHLGNEKDRLDDAMANLEFYRGDFARHPVRAAESMYAPYRYERHSLFMQRVVNVLCQNLYAEGPRRTLPDHAAASAWLEGVYRHAEVDALLQEADRLAVVGDVCAIQVGPGEDPDCPVVFTLWDASCFLAWVHPDDPRVPVAIATIDLQDNRRRLRLYTAADTATYLTAKLEPGQTSGGTAYRLDSRDANPYGVLPFATFHFRFPASEFWSGGVGTNLRQCNDYINFHLTDLGDVLRYSGKPIVQVSGAMPGWRPPSPIRAGDVWQIPGGNTSAADERGGDGRAEFLSADLGCVEVSWQDLQSYLDHALEMAGVAPGTVRIKVDAQSGVALVYEQFPLVVWAKGRTRPAAWYEANLARVVLTVGARHLGSQEFAEYRATAAQLDAAAARPGLVLRWPSFWPSVPGPEADAADQAELDMGITSEVELLMKRRQMTRDEAIAHLEQVAEDRELFKRLVGPTLPPPPKPPGESSSAPPDGTAPEADREKPNPDEESTDE